MLGDRLVIQESLFYQFRLDDHIPVDRMLRAIALRNRARVLS